MECQRWTVGDYTITSIVEEQSERLPPELFYPGRTSADVQRHGWLVPDFADARGRLAFRVQAFVITGNGRTLLVDPCVGNGKRLKNPYWNMRSLDRDPEAARASRRRMLDSAFRRGALVLGTHFPNRPAGKLIAEGAAYRFAPV